jgi:murein DD-endopeptidase MepM/ murein hydrolase activator NlpD
MPFVILSAGNLAASPIRMVTVRGTVVAVAALLVITLAGGVALGYQLASGGLQTADATLTPVLDPTRPESQALVDRIGSLTVRLLRLESDALSLARRVGVLDSTKRRVPPAAAAANARGETEPSGGPLLEPEDDPAVVVQSDIYDALARIDSGLDNIDASLALVTGATTESDLAGMAYPSRYPIPGARVSSGFGNRRDPFTNRLARHTGVDMPAPVGTPILASAGGRVRFAGFQRAYGNAVEIDHGDGLVTRYAHASKLLVRKGQVVLPDQAIARVGSTGRSTGPHLHFEVIKDGRLVQPLRYLERPGR